MIAEGYLKKSNRELLLVANNVSELMLKMDSYVAPQKKEVIHKVVKNDH